MTTNTKATGRPRVKLTPKQERAKDLAAATATAAIEAEAAALDALRAASKAKVPISHLAEATGVGERTVRNRLKSFEATKAKR